MTLVRHDDARVEAKPGTHLRRSSLAGLGDASVLALAKLLDVVGDPVEVSSLGGGVLFANAAWERLVGDVPNARPLWSSDERVASALEGVRTGSEWVGTMRDPAGNLRPAMLLPLRDASGAVAACLTLLRDPRGNAGSVGFLPPELEAAPLMVMSVDVAGGIVGVNAAWIAGLGYDRQSVLGRAGDFLLRPAPGGPATTEFWAEPMACGRSYRCLHHSGVMLDVELDTWSSEPTLGQRRIHALVREAGSGASEGDEPGLARRWEHLGRLALGVANDFEGVIGLVSAYAGRALQLLPTQGQAYQMVHRVFDVAQRSGYLTQQLRAMAASEEAAQWSDANDVLRELTAQLATTPREDVVVRVELADQPVPIRLPRARLDPIVASLVTNAIAAAPDHGSVVVRTGLAQLDERAARDVGDLAPGRYAVLEVTSTGPESAGSRRRSEPAVKAADCGFGLSVIEGVVRLVGGHLAVLDGDILRVHLPVCESVSVPHPSPRSWRGIRVLVVDDETPVRRAVAKIVATAGFEVLTARDAGDALAKLARERVDLVLTDVVMPQTSGVMLADLIRQSHPDVAIVLMSGFAPDLITGRGIDPRHTPYLQKPFTRLELLRKVERALGHEPAQIAQRA